MCPGVSERVADMPPPTAGRGPPDTDFPERPESGADFSGVLAALRVRARRGTRTHVGRILTAALTGVRTRGVYRHPYKHPYNGPYSDPYGDRYGGAGARRRGSGPFTAHKVGLVGRGHTPAGWDGGGVPRPQEVARTAKNRLRASLRRFRGFSGARGGSGWFRAATGLLGGATGVRQAGGRCRRRRPWRTSARHRAAWPGRLAPAHATARARRWSRCRASGR